MANSEQTPVNELPTIQESLRDLGKYGYRETPPETLKLMATQANAELEGYRQRAVKIKADVQEGLKSGDPQAFVKLKKKQAFLRGDIEECLTRQQRINNALEHQHLMAGMVKLLGSARRVQLLEGLVLSLIIMVLGLLVYDFTVPEHWGEFKFVDPIEVVGANTSSDYAVVMAKLADDPDTEGTQYNYLTIESPNADIKDLKVEAGDTVRFLWKPDGLGKDNYTEFVVDSVLGERSLRLSTAHDVAVETAKKVEICRLTDKSEQRSFRVRDPVRQDLAWLELSERHKSLRKSNIVSYRTYPGRPDWLSNNAIFMIDAWCCLIFMIEFFLRCACANSKAWFWRNHWIDFFTSIPVPGEAQLARFGRIARVARFARILRFARVFRALRVVFLLWRGMDKLQDAMDVKLMKRSLKWGMGILIVGGLLVFQLEHNLAKEGNDVTTVGGGIWWSFTTIVTGGYADIHNPKSLMGRLLTVLLVITGMILVGVFTATLTSLYVGEESEEMQQMQ
ncbi:MAG: ion transporter, partial [Pirellulaceae bacterium]